MSFPADAGEGRLPGVCDASTESSLLKIPCYLSPGCSRSIRPSTLSAAIRALSGSSRADNPYLAAHFGPLAELTKLGSRISGYEQTLTFE